MFGVAQVIGIKPTLRSFFSIGPPAAKISVAVLSGKNCDSAASAVDAPSDCRKAAAAFVGRKHRAHHRGGDDLLIAFVLTFDGYALQLSRGIALMLGLADMATACAAAAIQRPRRVEWIVECGHSYALR